MATFCPVERLSDADRSVSRRQTFPVWMRRILLVAAFYNLVWGSLVILFPSAIFQWTGVALPRYPEIWQCVGMIVGVYGVGYAIAASNPLRHWPVVFVGLLGKVLGPIGFLWAASSETLPWSWGWTIVANDLIWWWPFGAILFAAWRRLSDTTDDVLGPPLSQALVEFRSQRGASLEELSKHKPTLLVFLRHSGCTFCRANLHDLSRHRHEIEEYGFQIAIVHMSSHMSATLRFESYDLGDLHRYCDRRCQLYRAFGLERLRMADLLDWSPWWRTLVAAVWERHGLGGQDGDGFRRSGAFILTHGKVVAARRPSLADSRIDFLDLIRGIEPTQYRNDASDNQAGLVSVSTEL